MLQASIVRKKLLTQIPSASGVEVVNNQLFIIGDDSPVLYILDMQGELIHEATLFNVEAHTEVLMGRRIKKSAKPDFEAMTVLEIDEKKLIMVAGSGSLSPQRDGGYLIEPVRPYTATFISLGGIYEQLRQMPQVVGSGKLNIEGAIANEKYVYLLQRGNITGCNAVIRYHLQDFYTYLLQPAGQPPLPAVSTYVLPQLSEKQSGFSGACIIPGKDALLITASVEDTANEIDDGEVIGSFAGILPLEGTDTGNIRYVPFTENKELFIGKIESVSIEQMLPDGTIRAVAVTDNDSGYSELLFIEISQ